MKIQFPRPGWEETTCCGLSGQGGKIFRVKFGKRDVS